jgi:phosphoribosylformylglycinamidine synthase
VIRFPGSNCDQDALFALRDEVGVSADYVWHEETSLAGFEAAVLPGGFAYGDYLRCGAIAARAPIMAEVARLAREGRPVLGICNGFQILCEAGLLPGALMRNEPERFACKTVMLRAETRDSPWTRGVDGLLRVPIAHGEGRYALDEAGLDALEAADRIAFRYVDPTGNPSMESNPNGSARNVAGVLSEGRNVLGMMPHPERASSPALGSADGLTILRGLLAVAA